MPLLKVPEFPEKEVRFIGLLANADSSILELTLQHGFFLQEMMENRIAQFMATLEKSHHMDSIWQLLWDTRCFNKRNGRSYFITNSFQVDEYNHETLSDAIAQFEERSIERYLNTRFRLLRLYKEGNICIPLRYYYLGKEFKPEIVLRTIRDSNVVREPFQIHSSQYYLIHRFLHENSLPLKESFLQLAFETYEQSYNSTKIIQTYLTLLSSLELLFYPPANDQPLKRIARNVGVLLGTDKDRGRNIERDVSSLFMKRAHLASHADTSGVSKLDIIKLRTYIRESIKEFLIMGKGKQEALKLLNSTGFGKRIWKKDGKLF